MIAKLLLLRSCLSGENLASEVITNRLLILLLNINREFGGKNFETGVKLNKSGTEKMANALSVYMSDL